jgi:glycosyltransferase involved in cell wall biosynthesis
MIALARERGIAVAFGLHNFSYGDRRLFEHVDYTFVPSEFAARFYAERVGVSCHVLPYAIDWSRVEIQSPSLQYVTFVNPQPAKGVFVFARIAEEIARRRPDIALLVVEGRGGVSWLEQTGLDLSWAKNLHAMDNTHDPRDFYRVSKLLLVPSLWNESFGLVAAEAMLNRIPVLASNRGALPEVMGDAGFLFEIPERYQPDTGLVPTAAEVSRWVETIIRLWDDEAFYRQHSARAFAHAQRWRPQYMAPVYSRVFGNIASQRAPPHPRL